MTSSFNFRRDLITRPILLWARGVMPALSQTEREAIDAGDTWWDAGPRPGLELEEKRTFSGVEL